MEWNKWSNRTSEEDPMKVRHHIMESQVEWGCSLSCSFFNPPLLGFGSHKNYSQLFFFFKNNLFIEKK